jgi:uncharacterized protein (TIGR02646 family)
MLKIISSTISPTTQTHLNSQQADIDGQVSYEEQVNRAATLWNGKEGSIPKRAAFLEIKAKLTDNAVGEHYCGYCEHNEHSDIEHIYPKGLYPNKAFVWENYMWACKKCNSGLKLDKFKIFNPLGSSSTQDITPQHNPRTYVQPSNEDNVLINPRVDDPLDFLFLDLKSGVLVTHPSLTTPRDIERANYTLELLKIDIREGLKKARIIARKGFINSLKRYIIAKNATSFKELEECMEELHPVIFAYSLEIEKTTTYLSIKEDIITRNHPTVWKEMQRQYLQIPLLTRLFAQAPEALNW